MTLSEWLHSAALPRNEARLLLRHVCGYTAADLISRDGNPLSADHLAALNDLAARRRAGEPVAYLLGRREFYGRTFAVSPAVLIPRPETEHLVEAALARLPENGRLLDLGTGSGIVALTVKLERPDAQVFATDISMDALAVAQDNAARLGADVHFAQGSWFAALSAFRLPEKPFDLIVSNPPYIAAGDPHLSQGDLRFEPAGALTDAADGLAHIRTLAAGAPQWLKNGGFLLLEHGYDQGSPVRQIVREHGFPEVDTLPDLAGWDRVTLGRAA